MNALKFLVLFLWVLSLLAIVLFVIRQHPFVRRRKDTDMNASEGIYVVALLFAAAMVLLPVVQTLTTAYDIISRFYANQVVNQLLRTGSILTVIGILLYLLVIITARGLSSLFARRDPLIEFSVNNITYSIFRSALLLTFTFLVSSFDGMLFQNFLPAMGPAFYH